MASEQTNVDTQAVVVDAVSRETGAVSVEQLVTLGQARGLSPDQTFEGVRRATQQGKLRFDSEMKLVIRR
ncbi:MAG: hypothetical protein IPG45_15850 [Deltaproteobacteria bacterium]|nr:hypothetical protein [Deltaproteobacteria bacterium]